MVDERQEPALAMFSWGYAGWGNSLSQLLAVTAAAEHSRGFEPPVFVDVRFSRSVRAAGFRDRTFEGALPPGRYHWMQGLGNQAIGEGGKMRIYRPADAATLLDLAVEESQRQRRILFFCSCGALEGCHRNLVRELLLAEARRRALALEVAEWPGGEPGPEPICTLTFTPKEFSKILGGASRIPIDEELALGVFAAMPWGGHVAATDGVRHATLAVSAARFSAGKWFVLPVVLPAGYRVFRSRAP